ncbi:hypothetical protein HHI36_008044 [Cryptolaemus montrouzieri]|uniref:Uncharacterized protein n=1 Tax=Cryptolaemus montrouzieri TaxID=559131 RepID=A0ABD2MRL5_9CUCU
MDQTRIGNNAQTSTVPEEPFVTADEHPPLDAEAENRAEQHLQPQLIWIRDRLGKKLDSSWIGGDLETGRHVFQRQTIANMRTYLLVYLKYSSTMKRPKYMQFFS